MAKTLLVIFNGLFLICGIAMIGIGIAQSTAGGIKNLNQLIAGLDYLNVAVIVLGLVVCIISFLGCCGALKESNCMISLFMLFLTLILVAEVVAAGMAFKYKGEIKEFARTESLKALKDNKTAHAFDIIQNDWKCCGVDGAKDYTDNQRPIPASCCSNLPVAATCTTDTAGFHDVGCLPEIENRLKTNYLAVGVTALIIAFIEIIGIIFACCLRGAIQDKYQTV